MSAELEAVRPMQVNPGRKKKGKKRKSAGGPSEAERADKYVLYEDAVQDPEGDADRVRRMYKRAYGRWPRTLREDFCGTAVFACAWVKAHGDHRAVAIDLDPEPLDWGRRHHIAKLSDEARGRLEIIEGDVLSAPCDPVEVLVAFNFSYFIFRERETMKRYFERAHQSLADEGVFILDVYGGPEAQERREERREYEDYTYVWDQDVFDPITHAATCLIHFEFNDKSEIRNAFSYRWRVWSIPELRDLLAEAGFSETTVYWEGTEKKTNEPNGVYRPREHAEDDPAWVAYISAKK